MTFEQFKKNLSEAKQEQPQKIVYVQAEPTTFGLPAFLSLIIPGLGQILKGHVFAGLCAMIMTPIAYMFFILPGVIFHLIVIYDAYNSKR